MSSRQRTIVVAVVAVFVMGFAGTFLVATMGSKASPAPSAGAGASEVAAASASSASEPSDSALETTPAETPAASATASDTSPAASAPPTSTPAPASPKPTPTATPTKAPTPVPVQAPEATVEFVGLGLSDGMSRASARTFKFTSEGLTPVAVKITAANAGTKTRLCLREGTSTASCATAAKPSMTRQASAQQSTWTVTLLSDGTLPTKAVVTVTITWHAKKASIELTNGTFNYSPQQYNGVTVLFAPRAKGQASVRASWTKTADAGLYILEGPKPPAAGPAQVLLDDHYEPSKWLDVHAWSVDPDSQYSVQIRNHTASLGTTAVGFSMLLTFP